MKRIILAVVLIALFAPAPAYACDGYVVRRGDSLVKIARRGGTTWQALAELNGIANPNLIYVGQCILLEGKAAISPQTAEPLREAYPRPRVVVAAGLEYYGDILNYNLDRAMERCPELISELSELRMDFFELPSAENNHIVAWADTSGVAHFRYVNGFVWYQALIAHEAAHVHLYKTGGDWTSEHEADVIANSCYPEWDIRP